MRAVFILGSGRKGGITETLCKAAARSMEESGVSVSFIDPYAMVMWHCRGCNKCRDTGICSINDDMMEIYDAVIMSDIIVIGTPIYFSGPSSMIKMIYDRFQWLWSNPQMRPEKKKVLALIMSGGDASPIFSNAISITKAFAATVGAEWAGEFALPDTDGTDIIPESVIREMYSFGSRIVSKYSGTS